MPKTSINIQDGFLFQSLKSGADVAVQLTTGERIGGRLTRFDRFAIIIDRDGRETMIYKHGIVSIEAPVAVGTEAVDGEG